MTNTLPRVAGEGRPAHPRIGVPHNNPGTWLAAWLKETARNGLEGDLTPEFLGTADVIGVVMWNQILPEIEALSVFVRTGGGLVAAAMCGGRAQLDPGQDLVSDYDGDRLLTPIGIQWLDHGLTRTSPEGYAVDGPPPELTHAGKALDAIEALATDRLRLLADPERN